MDQPIITAARLREVLHYNPITGVFTWRVRTSTCVQVGDVAGGSGSGGYIDIRIDGRKHGAHRLAWLYMTGELPEHEIDHENTCRSDNRWDNLRDATHAQNMQNLRKAPSHNTSGFLGVSEDRRGLWRAQIMVGGRNKSLGYHQTQELAHAAYLEAKARLHPFQTLAVRPGH